MECQLGWTLEHGMSELGGEGEREEWFSDIEHQSQKGL